MLRLVLLSSDEPLRAQLAQSLGGEFEIVRVCRRTSELPLELARLTPRLLMVDIQAGGDAVREAAEAVMRLDTRLELVAVGDAANAGDVIRALRDGASDFIHRDEPAASLRQLVMQRLKREDISPTGPAGGFQVVLAPHGGLAASQFALSLALLRAGEAGEALLIDCGLPAGEAAPGLDLEASYTLWDAARDAERLDRTLLDAALARHAQSGVCVLPLAAKPTDEPSLSPESFLHALRIVRPMFRETVLYLGALRNPALLQVLPAATRIHVVCPQTFSAVRDARALISAMGPEIDRSRRVLLIVEEHTPEIGLSEGQMREALGVGAAVCLPPERTALANSLNLGQPHILQRPNDAYAQACRLAAGLQPATRRRSPAWLHLRERFGALMGASR